MGRILSAVVGAALVLSVSGGVIEATGGTVFAGEWTSVDVADGSTQYLLVSGDVPPHVTLVDLYARYCASHGAPTTVFTGSGDGTITVIEKEIASARLPRTVKSALARKYPGAAYKKIEEVIAVKGDKESLDFYELHLETAEHKKIEVQVGENGQIRKEEK